MKNFKVNLKQLVQNDITWRLLAVVAIVLASWSLHTMVDRHGEKRLFTPLNQAADTFAKNVNTWLQAKARQTDLLAKDPRLKQSFQATDWRLSVRDVRRTIYEFSYLNDIENVYAVNPTHAPHLVKTAGAPSIPLAIFKLLMANNQQSTALMVNVGDAPQLLVMLALTDPASATPYGYVAYLEPLKHALANLNRPTLGSGQTLALFRERGDGKTSALTNLSQIQLETLDPQQTTLPVFGGTGGTGHYTLNTPILATTTAVPNQQGWYAVSYRPQATAHPDNILLKWVLKIITAIACIALFAYPGNGAYAKLLGKANILKKAQPEEENEVLKPNNIDEALGGAFAAAGIDYPDDSELFANNARARQIYEKTQTHIARTAQKRYASKRQSGDEEEMSDNIILYIIRKSITDKNLRLLYQPIVSAADNSIVMYEVFLRLLDEDGTEISPGKFIPVAEQHNIMSELDEAVITKVLEDFYEQGRLPPAPLSINLSGDTFDSLGYMNRIITAAAEGKIPAGQITFELRSREIIADRRAIDFIRECRDMGFRFAMDYFGGGPQVLQAAKTLKFDYAKLDAQRFRGFTKKADLQKEFARLALVSKEIKLPLILERVETPVMDAFSRKLGVLYLQGYRFGAPEQHFATEVADQSTQATA